MDHSTAAFEKPATDVAAPPASNRAAMLIVFIVVFIDLLGFAIVLPLLPLIGDKYVEAVVSDGPNHKMISGAILGVLMASFSLMQFIFAPVWGRLSDRVGRRPILLLGLGASVVFYGLLGYACQLPGDMPMMAVQLLFLARIGAGIAGATIGTAQAVIADSTPPDKRKHGMALIGAAFGIGFTFGPLIGYGALQVFTNHLEAVGYTAAGLSLLAFVLGISLLPETRQFSTEPPVLRRGWNLGNLFHAIGNATIGPIVLVFFLSTVGFAAFETTFALFLNDAPFVKDQGELANSAPASRSKMEPNKKTLLFFAYVGFTLLLTQGYIYRKMAKRLSEVALMLIGILLMFLGVALLSVVCYAAFMSTDSGLPLMPMLFSAVTFAVMGFAFLTPSAQALISRRTPADRQGEILGINQSAAALARIIGPLVGIPLYASTTSHMLPYAFGAGLLLLMMPFMPRIRRGDAV